MKATNQEFDDYVCQAIENIDPQFKQYLDEVPVIVEDWPDQILCNNLNLPDRTYLLGLFQGIPLHLRRQGHPVTSQISLYRRNILALSKNKSQLIEQIRKTIIHELGHYLGFSEQQLRRHRY